MIYIKNIEAKSKKNLNKKLNEFLSELEKGSKLISYDKGVKKEIVMAEFNLFGNKKQKKEEIIISTYFVNLLIKDKITNDLDLATVQKDIKVSEQIHRQSNCDLNYQLDEAFKVGGSC